MADPAQPFDVQPIVVIRKRAQREVSRAIGSIIDSASLVPAREFRGALRVRMLTFAEWLLHDVVGTAETFVPIIDEGPPTQTPELERLVRAGQAVIVRQHQAINREAIAGVLDVVGELERALVPFVEHEQ